MITAIEGNRGEKVDRRVIPLGWGYIRGYAAPQYERNRRESWYRKEQCGSCGEGSDCR